MLAAFGRKHTSPPTLEELVPKRSLRRLHLRSYPGAAVTVAQTVGHRLQRLQAVLGFSPRQPAFIAGCWSAGAAPRRNPTSISHRREVIVNRQNLYIRLITRIVCQPAQNYMSDNTSGSAKPTTPKTAGQSTCVTVSGERHVCGFFSLVMLRRESPYRKRQAHLTVIPVTDNPN